jgi:hypothetical protein
MAPLVATLKTAQEQLAMVDADIAQVAKGDPVLFRYWIHPAFHAAFLS